MSQDVRGPAGPATVGEHIIARLYALSVRHTFGVQGDYVLAFCKLIEDSLCYAGWVAPPRQTCFWLSARL